MNKSVLSAGKIISHVLKTNTEVQSRVTDIFPIMNNKATLPYVYYRRVGYSQDSQKIGRGADTAVIQVVCCTEDYESGVDLAESVRNALDHQQAELDGLVMRSCKLTESDESWSNDAFIQNLIFTVKI
jgi:ABC-type branched-subunit amino acid transport system substrate-binding protein